MAYHQINCQYYFDLKRKVAALLKHQMIFCRITSRDCNSNSWPRRRKIMMFVLTTDFLLQVLRGSSSTTSLQQMPECPCWEISHKLPNLFATVTMNLVLISQGSQSKAWAESPGPCIGWLQMGVAPRIDEVTSSVRLHDPESVRLVKGIRSNIKIRQAQGCCRAAVCWWPLRKGERCPASFRI